MSNSLYGNFRHRKFTEIFKDADQFASEFMDSAFDVPVIGANAYATGLDSGAIRLTYYMLYARYGNSVIANSDENQFKYKCFLLMFQFAPSWQKKLEIQWNLRGLEESDLITGTKQINNHSFNPSSAPSTDSLSELETINEQTSTAYKKSKMDAYAILMSLLEKDVTEEYISKFKSLFLTIIEPEEPLWYITDTEED